MKREEKNPKQKKKQKNENFFISEKISKQFFYIPFFVNGQIRFHAQTTTFFQKQKNAHVVNTMMALRSTFKVNVRIVKQNE